jgi:hypothetical protein
VVEVGTDVPRRLEWDSVTGGNLRMKTIRREPPIRNVFSRASALSDIGAFAGIGASAVRWMSAT